MNLELVRKITTLERTTGVSVLKELPKVPPKNVLTAFQQIHIKDLADMVLDTPMPKLIRGLQLITPGQIASVDVNKLKLVLKHGDMGTVEQLQTIFSESVIINALQKLTPESLQSLLIENNINHITQVISDLK